MVLLGWQGQTQHDIGGEKKHALQVEYFGTSYFNLKIDYESPSSFKLIQNTPTKF